jgi:myosin heavy subunit
LAHCAELLGVNTEMFTYSLTEKKVQMGRGSIVSIALNVSQAEDNRDTVAKTLYSNMFDWTIVKVSMCLLWCFLLQRHCCVSALDVHSPV